MVARHGRVWSQREFSIVKAFGGLFGKVASQTTREGVLLHQRRLDELVEPSRRAIDVGDRRHSPRGPPPGRLASWPSSSTPTSPFCAATTTSADSASSRRSGRSATDFVGPDPLGEVRFDADPLFMATKDLREPYLPGYDTSRRVHGARRRGFGRDARRRARPCRCCSATRPGACSVSSTSNCAPGRPPRSTPCRPSPRCWCNSRRASTPRSAPPTSLCTTI